MSTKIIWQSSTSSEAAIPDDRPFVHLNAGMTVDGKIATWKRDSRISSEEDLIRVHQLRSQLDAIMVGIGTVVVDDPKLTVHKVAGRNPVRIIVDSKARIPLKARIVTDKSSRTIIAITTHADPDKIKELQTLGVETIVAGEGPTVNLKELMSKIRLMGVRTLLLEGGGELNWGMLSQGLVDRVSVAVAPRIVGGDSAVTLVRGKGFAAVHEGIPLELSKIELYGRDIVLTYDIKH